MLRIFILTYVKQLGLVTLVCLFFSLQTIAQPIDLNDAKTVEVLAKNKTTHTKWTPRDTVTLNGLPNYTFTKDADLTPYGGSRVQREKATGYFHVKQVDGVWWIIDPDGGRFISKGINSVYLNRTERSKTAVDKRFGNEARWARDTKRLLLSNGFNTLGCWSDLRRLDRSKVKMPYTLYMKLMAGFARERGLARMGSGNNQYDGDAIPVFDPAFKTYCEERFAGVAEQHAKDPWLLGVFSDNELPLRGDALSTYLALKPGNVNRAAAEQWWQARQGNKPRKPNAADEEAFLEYVAETYYRIMKTTMKRHLPNHLYIGSRLINSSAKSDAVMRAGKEYIDIWSINYYGRWSPRVEEMDRWLALSGRPFIITEWYAKGHDTGLDNLDGAGFTVQNQADRGRFYHNFTLHLMAHRGNVGWHWFKYADDDESDREASISNKGVFDADYRPYTPLLEQMQELNQQVYRLRPILLVD